LRSGLILKLAIKGTIVKFPNAIKAAILRTSVALLVVTLLSAVSIAAQTTAFTYQGKLADSGNPANGNYDFQFRLFNAVSGGTLLGSPVVLTNVTVSNGSFTVTLDFGACPTCFDGTARFLEIAVKPTSGSTFTNLSPRQQVNSTPYAIKSLNAANATTADGLSVACVNCVTSSQIASVNGGVVTGTIPVASVPSGSANYIQNTTSQQATSNFNISGNGIISGNVGIGTTTPFAKLEVSGTGIIRARINSDSNAGVALNLNEVSRWSLATATGGNFQIYNDATSQNAFWIDGTNNNVGIGTNSPTNTLDVFGFFRASHPAGGNVVSETTGGTNAWAKLWMKTPVQSWSIGSSNGFNGNQLYFSNESLPSNNIQLAIMPNGNVGIGTVAPAVKLHVAGTGVLESSVQSTNERAILSLNSTISGQNRVWTMENGIFGIPGLFGIYDRTAGRAAMTIDTNGLTTLDGKVRQGTDGYGLPKAMIYVNGDGTLLRCYNGITGSTTGGCLFSTSRSGTGDYTVNLGFDASTRFILVSVQDGGGGTPVGISYQPLGNSINVFVYDTSGSGIDYNRTDRPFTIVIY
jgi:hypothetical protein